MIVSSCNTALNTQKQSSLYALKNLGVQSIEPVLENNWAFIDMQNLYRGVQEHGWKIEWKAFRRHLRVQYNVTKAIVFMGYIRENEGLYTYLRKAGFALEFRQVIRMSNGIIDGGNVDADLASYVMDYKTEYHKAIIVADDGDYCRTIMSLHRQNKLRQIISSHSIKATSRLIKQSVPAGFIASIQSIRNIVGHCTAQNVRLNEMNSPGM